MSILSDSKQLIPELLQNKNNFLTILNVQLYHIKITNLDTTKEITMSHPTK